MDSPPGSQVLRIGILFALIGVVLLAQIFLAIEDRTVIPYSEFRMLLTQGEVLDIEQ
jgi:hypothetical protein